MDDNVILAGGATARARARWFLIPAIFWISLGAIAQQGDVRIFLLCVGISSPFFILWYFAGQGRAWAFLVGALYCGLGAIASVFTGQIIGIVVSGFVAYRLWTAFLDCALLETAKRAQFASANSAIIPTSVSSLIPLGAQQPIRIAADVDGPSPAPWVPYRSQQGAPPAAAGPSNERG